jgi:hypothetical protein
MTAICIAMNVDASNSEATHSKVRSSNGWEIHALRRSLLLAPYFAGRRLIPGAVEA